MIDDTYVTPQNEPAAEPIASTLSAAQKALAAPSAESVEESEETDLNPVEAPLPSPAAPAAQAVAREEPPAELQAELQTEWQGEPQSVPQEPLPASPAIGAGAAAPDRPTVPARPAVLAPSPSLDTEVVSPTDETAAMGGYWRRVLTGNPDTVPQEVRSLAGADDDSLDAEEQNYRLLGTINRSWAVDHLGMSRESVQGAWKECRARLAESMGVADNEQEVFMGLSAGEDDKPRREAGKRIFEKAYLAGLKGELGCDIRAEQEGLDAVDRASAEALENEARFQGEEMRRKWLPLAESVARGADAFAGAEEDFLSAPRVLNAVPDLLHAVDAVAELGEEDRETVLFLAAHLAKQQRPAGEEGLGSRLVRAVRRGAGNIGMGVAQIVNHAGMVTLSNLGDKLGGKTGAALRETADAWDRRATVLRRLRELSQQEIAPLYPADAAHRAESYLIDAAEATPAALLAFCGGTGFAALAASGMGESVSAARSLNPQGDHELQLAAGILGGAVQGAIYMGMGRLGGRMLEQSIANFMKSRGAGIGAFSMNALKSAGALSLHGAELIAAGKLSQATEMGAQELAAQLSGTASHIDWRSFGDNLTDIETNMREAAAILPFLLIGSGRVALRHFRSPHAVLGEGLALRQWGIDDATRLQILNAPNVDVQGTMLSEALRGSKRWSAPGFMPEIVRAMNLFNGDYFQGFRDVECVCDFLKMPADRSVLGEKVIVERDATSKDVFGLEGHVGSRELPKHLKKKKMFAEAMRFWDQMYQKSHVAEYTPRRYFGLMPEGLDTPGDDRMAFYSDVTTGTVPTIPRRMRNVGYYNPQGEAERRALVRDRIQECLDLSYQFVMCTYSVDSLIENGFSVSRIATHLELSRNNVIGQMARAVLNMAMGMRPQESMRDLAKKISWHCVRRAYRGATPLWMNRAITRDLKHMDEFIPTYSSVLDIHRPDFKNVLRVINGMNACARTLVRLWPMTSDFQTALTRGMSPLQAYHHLLVRELGFRPEKVKGYPMKQINESANLSNMELFCEQNHRLFELAHCISGLELEQCKGEDGLVYWRVPRPDGGFTRWHAEKKDAINELAFCVGPYFGPLGMGIHKWLFPAASKKHFDLAEMPRTSYHDFTGFDQLCSIAMRDLGDYWHHSVTRTLPGFLPRRMRAMQTGRNTKDPFDPHAKAADAESAGVDIALDRMALITPATFINGRFLVFWERALNAGLVSVPEAGEFLMQRGYLTPERYRKIVDLSRQLPYPKRRTTPLRLTPPPDIAGMHREMAREMANFHRLYFYAHVQEQNLPESVKAWFRLVPFCPDMPSEDFASGHRVRNNYKGLKHISWNNHMVAMKLRQMAPDIDAMRRHIAENPLGSGRIGSLFRQAVGESEAQRCEQGWCYHYCGPGVFCSTPQKSWSLMLAPMDSWKLLTGEEKDDLRLLMGPFCREDPTPEALDAAGRGEEVDYLEYSLRQLDRVLKRLPELHRYAPAEDKIHALRSLQLDDAMQERDPNAEPEMSPVPLRWLGDFKDSYSVESLPHMPEALMEDKEALSSLRFLDTLRRVALSRPFAMDNGIWWGKTLYGGQFGMHPRGLEDWQVEEPLEPLFQLLGNIDKICRDSKQDSLSVCGMKLHGAVWSKADFDELAAVSIYRWPENRARTYRLMPGYPDSPNLRVRTPYVVPCHQGTYLDGDLVIRSEEKLFQSFYPLERFHPSRLRYFNKEHLRQWRNVALESVLDAIADRPTYLEACGNAESGIVGMGELLLRLCEDSGFCHAINPDAPQELSLYQAHVVQIATAMLECMQQGASHAAMERLRAASLPLQKDPKLRHEILRMLRNCCDKLGEDTGIHNNLLRQLELNWDEMDEKDALLQADEGEAPEETNDDFSQFRQGDLPLDDGADDQ